MPEQKPDEKLTLKKGIGCIGVLIAIAITTPIWYWLVYQILVRVDATPTMWVFYWIYLPAGLLLAILRGVTDTLLADKK